MTKEDWYEELRMDAHDEARQEAVEEYEIRHNLEYALEKLGIYDVYQEIVDLTKRLDSYGFEYTTAEVIDMLKEI